MLSDPSQVPLTEAQAAQKAGVSKGTLRRWRSAGEGPPWLKLGDTRGAAIRYDSEALQQWLVSRRKDGNQAAA
jgi:hypothetical protein